MRLFLARLAGSPLADLLYQLGFAGALRLRQEGKTTRLTLRCCTRIQSFISMNAHLFMGTYNPKYQLYLYAP